MTNVQESLQGYTKKMYRNPQKYGSSPYDLVVVHGGPGALGTVAELAKGLSGSCGVLEPFQTSMSIEGQILELKNIIKAHGKLPVTLVGHSWGALLSFMVAARYPGYVKKLIIISSSPFEDNYTSYIMQKRLHRMEEENIEEYIKLSKLMDDPSVKNKDYYFSRFGDLMSEADSFDLVSFPFQGPGFSLDMNRKVRNDATLIRSSGKLLDMGKSIKCPVVAIHGKHDPHPYDGVIGPLSRSLKDFRFFLLDKCGHYPWLERQACDEFYMLIQSEIAV